MEKIKKAVERNELHLFLLGLGEYHVSGWTDLPDPNDFSKCWRTEIIPYSQEVGPEFQARLKQAIYQVLEFEKDPNLALYTVMIFFNWYFVFKDQNMISFDLDFSEFVASIKSKLIERKQELMKDKRWAGAEWNSKNGLWGPLLNVAEFIKKKTNGLDVNPESTEDSSELKKSNA